MKNFNKPLLALLLAAFALFGAGNSASAEQGASLPAAMLNQEWTLINYQVEGQMSAAVLPPNPITINFTSDGAVNGSGGCNSYGGQYQAGANGSLTLRQIISTLMACADNNVNQWEGKYYDALNTVSGYKLDGDNLQIFFNNGQGTLTFIHSAATPPATPVSGAVGNPLPSAVVNQQWNLINYQVEGEANAAVLPPNPLTIMFDGAGQASGTGGCNSYGVQYQVGPNNSLTLSELITTKRACIQGNITAWETKYFTALQSVSSYALNGDNLQLTFSNGQGILTFEKAGVIARPTVGATTPGMPTTGGGSNYIGWLAALIALVLVAGASLRLSGKLATRRS